MGVTGPTVPQSAEIQGRDLESVFALPGSALRDGERVYVLDAEDRIRFRDVKVIRRDRHRVLVGEGLVEGDRVVTSPMSAVTNGMLVRPLDTIAPPSSS